MNIEENRLMTFTDWPANAAVDAFRIAKAGFYYSGHALEVQCFLCGVKISDWNYGDQVMVRHRLAAPDCPFVKNSRDTCNVPLVPTAINDSTLESLSSAEGQQDNYTLENTCPNFNQNNEHEINYESISQRLQTFINWPISSTVSPEDLAKAGFYYLQHDDYVKCVYCKGILKSWKTGDNPFVEHKKYFPNCDFHVYCDDLSLMSVQLRPGRTSNVSELNIKTKTDPKEPSLATYERRLCTFNGWPKNLKQTPEMLASAGFYYTGFPDSVTCFHCDGTLRNWEVTDEAWSEHARWFPKCEFVHSVRGQEFIHRCIVNRPPLDKSIFEGVPEDENIDVSAVPSTSTSSISPIDIHAKEAELEKLILDPHSTLSLEIRFHVYKIIEALKNQIVEMGVQHMTIGQLIPDTLFRQITKLLNEYCNSEQSNEDLENKHEMCANKNEDIKLTPKHSDNPYKEKKTVNNIQEPISMEEENRRLKEARLCKICMDREVAIVFLPCGHLATCAYCAPSLKYCPMCRQQIQAVVRTFLS